MVNVVSSTSPTQHQGNTRRINVINPLLVRDPPPVPTIPAKKDKIFEDFEKLLVDYNITFRHLQTVKKNKLSPVNHRKIIPLEKKKPETVAKKFVGLFQQSPRKIVVTFMNSGVNDRFYINYEGIQHAIGQIEIKGRIEDISEDLDNIPLNYYAVFEGDTFKQPKTKQPNTIVGGRRKLKGTRRNRRKNRKSRKQRHH